MRQAKPPREGFSAAVLRSVSLGKDALAFGLAARLSPASCWSHRRIKCGKGVSMVPIKKNVGKVADEAAKNAANFRFRNLNGAILMSRFKR